MIEIEKCLKVIKSGGIILYPTDTIYGLGCDAYNLNTIRKISCKYYVFATRVQPLTVHNKINVGTLNLE